MVEEKVLKAIAFRIDVWLFAETGWPEEWKSLQSVQRGLTLCHGDRRARH